jgi:uncharacterized NAD-dependent epimerase/dehydratase family protein
LIKIQSPFLLFLGDAQDQLAAKTADGIAYWRPHECVGQLRLPGCAADVGLPDRTLAEARKDGAKTLVLGVANRGGIFSKDWINSLSNAVDMGYNIASGLHDNLNGIPNLEERANTADVKLINVRSTEINYPIGTGKKRPGKRLLTVGSDCSVGKMFTALAVERYLQKRDINATFRASGQTGILIAGSGICIDAIVSDFVAGAAELLSPDNDSDHWDIIEGQGSLYHPSYAGVSLGLLHGSQPDALILCHDPDRDHMRGLVDYSLPKIRECISLNETCGQLTNPKCRVIGISINTKRRSPTEARKLMNDLETELNLPCVDPIREGAERLLEAVLLE